MTMTTEKKRGFARMTKEERSAMGRKGGKARLHTPNRVLTVARTGLLFQLQLPPFELGGPSSESLWKGWRLRIATRSRGSSLGDSVPPA